jgi:hypothetical protein
MKDLGHLTTSRKGPDVEESNWSGEKLFVCWIFGSWWKNWSWIRELRWIVTKDINLKEYKYMLRCYHNISVVSKKMRKGSCSEFLGRLLKEYDLLEILTDEPKNKLLKRLK